MNQISPVYKNLGIPIFFAVIITVFGSFGHLNAAWGYGMFLVSVLFLSASLMTFSILIFSKSFNTQNLQQLSSQLFKMGAWLYLLAVGALGGFFIHETLLGRMETRWIFFGPAAVVAIIALDWGLYKLVVEKNLPTWHRFGSLVSREASEPSEMRRVFLDEVVLHRSLFSVSRFRWLRHTLIFWGFSAMFGLEILAVFVREAWPAFGGEDIWEHQSHPLRLAFDFGYDFTGLMVLLGCIMALCWRVIVNGRPEQKYTDTWTSMFLFLVAFSGFVVEAVRLSQVAPDPIYWGSFVGYPLSMLLSEFQITDGVYLMLWYLHVLGSCAFIAYVPAKRLIHSCATPIGRLMNSQKNLLEIKRRSVLKGLFRENG